MALLFVTGCTSWRDYVRQDYKVGPNYCQPDAAVAEHWLEDGDPAVSSRPITDAAWWRAFDDPVLDSLVQTAYRQNLTLRAAGLRIIEARAQRGIVVGELFPQSQQAFGTFTRTGSSENTANVSPARFYDEWTLGASLAWELDFWGRFRRAVEAADANLDATIAGYDDVLVLLQAEVAQSYVDLRTAEQRLESARRNVETQRGSLKLADVKFRNGATTRLDVTQGQSSLNQTESFIPPLEAARRQAANQLSILLGMPPGEIDDALARRRPIPAAPAEVVIGIPADLLRRRPDIRRAERDVAAQSARIGIAVSDLYPHFSISGSVYFDAARFEDLFRSGSLAGNVGPSFRWDILNYGRLLNNIRVEDARFRQRVVEYQDLVLKANAEAENALIGFLRFQQQVKFLTESIRASEQSLGLVRDQYGAGKTDFNRVLNVEQSLTQQQDLLAVAQGAVARNLVQVYRALGGGWQIRCCPTPPPQEAEGEQTLETVPTPAPSHTMPHTAPARTRTPPSAPLPPETAKP